MEQATTEGPVPGITQVIIKASAIDRDDINTIHHEVRQDVSSASLKALVKGPSSEEGPECLQTIVRIIFPPSRAHVERLKLTAEEGLINVNLLDLSKRISSSPDSTSAPFLQIKDLYTRITSGKSDIRAEVSVQSRIGGSHGIIQGELLIRKELAVNLIDGHIRMNLAQVNGDGAMESKFSVRNGNIDVGIVRGSYWFWLVRRPVSLQLKF